MNYFLISHQFCIYSLNLLRERENDTDPVNLQVVFAGDKVPHDNRVLISCNHRTEVDWMYIWNLAIRKGKVGYCKYAVKSSVRNAPIFGWAFWVFEFLMLDRKWEVDSPVIESYLQSFKDPADPIWLVIFPEGTDFT
jgi:lysocardiolipin and lysophospholipid acyltransferase